MVEKLPDLDDPDLFAWIDLSQEAELSGLADRLGLHPLILTNAGDEDRRSKIRNYDDGYTLIVLNAVVARPEGPGFIELINIIGPRQLITMHREPLHIVDDLWQQVRDQIPVPTSVAHLLYLLLDRLVDAYFPVLDGWNDRLTTLESQVLLRPEGHHLSELLQLKKKLLGLRRTLAAQREILGNLARRGRFAGDSRVRHYFSEVYDHLILALEMVDNLREVLSATLEGYLSVVSNRTNEIMKTLTIIATIGLPLSLITSIYGMNFYMPETEWAYGYAYVWILMLTVSGGMLLYFRWRRWL